MSKVLKGVLTYTFIIIAILLVFGMLIFGIMFITANSKMQFSFFGFKALHKSRVKYENAIVATKNIEPQSEIDININSGNFKLSVIQSGPDGTQNIVVSKYDDLIGIYRGEYTGPVSTSMELDETTNKYVVNIDIHDVNGLVSYGNSYVDVILPTNKNFKYNLNIVSKNGDVELNGNVKDKPEYTILVNDLKVETNRGKFLVNKLGTLNQDENAGEGNVTLNSVYFKTNGGVFDLSKIKKLSVLENEGQVSTIVIDSKRGDFKFNDINAPMLIEGEDVRIVANKINTKQQGFTFKSPKGFFKINEIITEGTGVNEISTNVINVEIEKITGETLITTTYGNIVIGTLNNNSTLKSVNGNITVTTANGNVTATSKFGDINIGGFKKLVSITNEKGNITAKYIGELTETNTIEVKNNDGKTTLENIYGPLSLTINGDGNVNVTFASLAQSSAVTHNITLKNGEANLKVKIDTPFRLKAKGNVTGTLGSTNIAELIASAGQEVIIPVFGQNNNCLFNINAGSGKVTFQTITV